MKINKKISFIICIMFLFLLSSCGSLEVPTNLNIENRVLTWNEVSEATTYKISINDIEYESTENSFTIPSNVYGSLKVKVKALNNKYTSEYSNVQTFNVALKLNTPVNLRQDGNLVIWDNVENCDKYIIDINGTTYESYENQYELSPNILTRVRVLAAGKIDGSIISSDFSDYITIKPYLSTVENIEFSNGVLTWNSVENATEYEVVVNSASTTVTKNSLSLKFIYQGEVTIKIRAIGNENYNNSIYSDEYVCNVGSYQLPSPINLKLNNDTISWDRVEFADNYDVYVNNELKYENVNDNSCVLSSEILSEEYYFIQVVAKKDGQIDSELSNKLQGGNSSIDNPIKITDEEQFKTIGKYGYYILENNIEIENSLTLIKEFNGYFDGNNHTITINNLSDDEKFIGIFGIIEEATIKNLKIVVNVEVDSNKYESHVGLLAGLIDRSNVENIEINGEIEVNSKNGISRVGSLCGTILASNVTKVEANVTINTTNATIGGLFGSISNGNSVNLISECSYTGTINAQGTEQSNVGGFAGEVKDNYSTIQTSFSKYTLNSNAAYCGGFVGYMGSGNIKDCYSQGQIKSTTTSITNAIGGFIGRLEGYNVKVSRSIAINTIENQSGTNVGGFSGYTVGGSYGGNIYNNCYYDGTLANIDRIGNSNGRGDGILSKTSNDLKSLDDESYNSNWVINDEVYPKLKWE